MLKKITFISFLVLVITLCLFKMPSSYSKLNKSADSKNSIELKSYSNNYCKSENCNFDYTGTEQMFIAPKSGKYKIEAWGAQGGTNNNYKNTQGGSGSYTAGIVNLKKGNNMYVYVGGMGKCTQESNDIAECVDGGYNGGGVACQSKYSWTNYTFYGSGGGATDVRLVNGNWNDFSSIKSRIITAAGGGGFLYDHHNYPTDAYAEIIGGAGGGLIGYELNYTLTGPDYMSKYSPTGATQITGGIYKQVYYGSSNSVYNGQFGYAYLIPTSKSTDIDSIAGGGNGYYGGSEGSGGSSFISGHNGCVAITEDSTESNIKQRTDSNGKTCTDGTTDITCSYHYSGYKFTDTVMIDGAGYNWTTVKGDYVGQPQPDGTVTTGHSGNGYARITYIGE